MGDTTTVIGTASTLNIIFDCFRFSQATYNCEPPTAPATPIIIDIRVRALSKQIKRYKAKIKEKKADGLTWCKENKKKMGLHSNKRKEKKRGYIHTVKRKEKKLGEVMSNQHSRDISA